MPGIVQPAQWQGLTSKVGEQVTKTNQCEK